MVVNNGSLENQESIFGEELPSDTTPNSFNVETVTREHLLKWFSLETIPARACFQSVDTPPAPLPLGGLGLVFKV